MDIAEGEREKERTMCFRVPFPRARRFIQLHPPSCISGTDRVSMSGTVPADSFVNPPLRRRLLSLRVPHIYGRGERERQTCGRIISATAAANPGFSSRASSVARIHCCRRRRAAALCHLVVFFFFSFFSFFVSFLIFDFRARLSRDPETHGLN